MNIPNIFVLAASLALWTPQITLASLVTFTFEGVVIGSRNSLASYFSGGDLLSGSFTYDTSYPDQFPLSTTAGVYGFPYDRFNKFVTSFSATIGTHQLGIGTNSMLSVRVDDGTGVYDHDEFGLHIHNPTHPTLPTCGSDMVCDTEYFSIVLMDSSKSALASDAVPASLDLNAFDSSDWALSINGGQVYGTITALAPDVAPVPLPAAWALLLPGLTLIGMVTRRRT